MNETPNHPLWQARLVQADRHWATQHRTNPLPPDRMVFLFRAFAGLVRDLELETANRTALLRRLVEAVNGGLVPGADIEPQAQEALRTVKRTERYLLSLNNEQEVA